MKNKVTIKISLNGKRFLEKLRINRIKVSSDDTILSYAELLDSIVQFFKLNNDAYKSAINIKLGGKTNV